MNAPRLFVLVSCLSIAACASNPATSTDGTGGSQDGSGGTNGSGGAPSGSGGKMGTGGSGSGGAVSMGTNTAQIPFPQNKKPANCALTTMSGASTAAQSAYNSWKTMYVTSTGAGSNLRVQRPGNPNNGDTVSEGIGYGMIAAAYLGDKATFDGLWGYAKAHWDAKGLMNWHISAGGTPVNQSNGTEPGSASDGDEDMAWALIMASHQWSNPTYLADAKDILAKMFAYSIGGDGILRPGDGWGTSDIDTFPDYFSPAYFRVFATVTGKADWSTYFIDRNYAILANFTGANGLVPDQVTATGTTYAVASTNCTINGKNCGNYGYDACRTPWRIGMDYCFNGEPRAKAYLDKVGGFFNSIGGGPSNIVDGYSPSGAAAGTNNHNMAFIGPAGVAGMSNSSFQSLLDGAYSFGASMTAGDYFKDSLRVVTMLVMSGNFYDVSGL